MDLFSYLLASKRYPHQFGKDYNYLKSNNRAKATNQKTPFYYNDLICYINIQNPTLPKSKPNIKILYTDIMENGSRDHVIYGETQWKNKINNLQVSKIWNNTYYPYSKPCN